MLSLCLLAVGTKFLFVGLATSTSSKATTLGKKKVLLREKSPIYHLSEREGFLEVGKGC